MQATPNTQIKRMRMTPQPPLSDHLDPLVKIVEDSENLPQFSTQLQPHEGVIIRRPVALHLCKRKTSPVAKVVSKFKQMHFGVRIQNLALKK